MIKSGYKKIGITFALVFSLLIFSITIFSGCSKEPDYTNLVSSTYVPSNIEIFTDEFGFKSLKKDSQEPIKILQLTDIHIGNGPLTSKRDRKAIEAVCKMIESSRPDLIVLSGDLVYPTLFLTGTNDNLTALKVLTKVIDAYKTPWTICFGNHDAESTAKYSKSELCDFLEGSDLSYCLFSRGPSSIDGMGNHIINLYNSNGEFNTAIFLLDNGMYNGDTQLSGYMEVTQSQTSWYEENVNLISNKVGKTIQSFVFYHVPGKEYELAWKEFKSGENQNVTLIYGYANEPNEKISCPSELGTFWNKVQDLGSTKAIFCGHDHLNDFSVEYYGVRLTFSKSIDYTAYAFQGIAEKTEQRGGTIISVSESGGFEISAKKLVDIK